MRRRRKRERRRRRRANSDVEETPTPIDSADPGVVPRSLPGFCDSASCSPFLFPSLSLSPLSLLFRRRGEKILLLLVSFPLSPFAFSSLPTYIYIYIYLSPFPRFVAGIFPSPRGYVRGLRCTSRFSSLFVHVVVCRRRRRMPRWFVCVPYNLDAYSRTSSNRSYRLRRSSFSSLSTPFSLLLFIYPSCFPWFKGCR